MPTKGHAAEAAQIIDRLERLARSGEARHGINPAQWEALRYLARANRFSRTPAALADYLASTRGTVSQTLIALEGKGLVARQQSARDRRSVNVDLTDSARKILEDDPLQELVRDLRKGSSEDALAAAVEVLRDALRRALQRNGGRPFGVCHDCRHFQKHASGRGKHHCALIGESLSEEDSALICAEQDPVLT